MCMGSHRKVRTPEAVVAQADVDAELWDYYKTEYKPLITKYAAQVTSSETQKAESQQVAGQINAEVMKAVRPGDVSDNPVANAKRLITIGDIKTSTQQAGENKVKSKQIGDVQNIINIGRGQATNAVQDLGTLAEASLQKELLGKELNMEETANMQNTIGSAAGTIAAGAMYGAGKYKADKQKQLTETMLDWTGEF